MTSSALACSIWINKGKCTKRCKPGRSRFELRRESVKSTCSHRKSKTRWGHSCRIRAIQSFWQSMVK